MLGLGLFSISSSLIAQDMEEVRADSEVAKVGVEAVAEVGAGVAAEVAAEVAAGAAAEVAAAAGVAAAAQERGVALPVQRSCHTKQRS